MFLDRDRELAWLDDSYSSGQAELLLLYGRRRVGKSALLSESCLGKPHVYFLASQVRESDNLDQRLATLLPARSTGTAAMRCYQRLPGLQRQYHSRYRPPEAGNFGSAC